MLNFEISTMELLTTTYENRALYKVAQNEPFWGSKYVYCLNNPLRNIDPDGRDVWTINSNGTINHEKNKKIDRIDVVDKNDNTTKGTEAEYGSIKHHTVSIKVEGKEDPISMDYFEIKGDNLGKETFENAANNTSTEWTHAKVGTEDSENNIVGTSHSENSTSVGSFLEKTGYTLKEVNHNHPNGNNSPSNQDIKNRNNYLKQSPNVKLNIYSKQKGYSPYTTLEDIMKSYGKNYTK